MGHSEVSFTDEISGSLQTRKVNLRAMPLWRKSNLVWGILRGALYYRLAGYKRFPIIHRGVKVLTSNGIVRIGHFSEIHDRVVLSAIGEPGESEAKLSLGDHTSIWYGTVISARHEITIGQQCAISWNCTVIDDDMHEILYSEEGHSSRTREKAVRIGDHVWIGASAVVLKGVTIGDNAIVAAGAIVTRDVPPHTLVAGNPAKPIRRIAGWR